MTARVRKGKLKGFTLVELVISMLVFTISVVGVYSASSRITNQSADPLLRSQALAIAKSYMEEVRLKQYAPLSSCPTVPGTGGRANFSHVCHYSLLIDGVAKDQFGNNLSGFSQYSVKVTVNQSSVLGPFGSQVPLADALLITVTVDHAANPTGSILAKLSAYRVNY